MKLNTIIGILFLVVNVLCLTYNLFLKDKITIKSKKIMGIIVIFSLIAGFIYFDTHYAVINKKIYNINDITETSPYLNIYVDITNIREINKCTELEEMLLSHAPENSISRLKDFHNLNRLLILSSDISSADSEKISKFDKLEHLSFQTSDIDFKGFNSDTVSYLAFYQYNTVINFEALSECKSLEWITIWDSTISDNCIVKEDYNYIMKDSSVFASFDYVKKLCLMIDRIEDISGILEMDSLKEFRVNTGAVSEDNIKLLEDKGISVIEDE